MKATSPTVFGGRDQGLALVAIKGLLDWLAQRESA